MGIPFLEDVLGRISEATQAVPSGVAALPVVGIPVASAIATSALVQSVTDDRGAFDGETAAATADADAERARAWGERDALTTQVSSLEYSEHAIVDDDPFDAMSHSQIFDHVNEMDPATLNAIGEAWKAIAGRVEAGIGNFQNDVNGAITEGWQGRGGSAALEAVLAYSADAGELKVRVDLISNKIEEAKIALDEAKRSIPAPDGASTVERFLSLVPGATWKQAQYEAEEAERQARQVMKDVYLPYMKRADDQVPILPAAFNPVTGSAGAGSGGAFGGGGSGGENTSGAGNGLGTPFASGGGAVGGVDGGHLGGANPAGDNSRPDNAGQDGSGQGFSADDSRRAANGSDLDAQGNSGADAARSANDSSPAGTAAANAGPLPAGAAPGGLAGATPNGAQLGSGVPSGLMGSGSGGGSAGGIGTGGFGPGGTGGGALGPGGVGGLSGGGRGGVNGTGGTSATGAQSGRGAMGGVGGMAPGRGQGQDEDNVHDTPGYLVTVENGNALIGDLPMVSPAVLGE
ncbi:hypothetical protein R3Q06_06910 [Rhodococcus erythropolis]|uniref:hypothetical protein n=1 Tax=Rhodococcus erythropolis TaxID=1833 RepID=UPI00294A963F|nr:hypothetical protein [Rhodococcus erythropolis]MDV6273224.1 hypothetical protein [Rhodococcus erythropolis]